MAVEATVAGSEGTTRTTPRPAPVEWVEMAAASISISLLQRPIVSRAVASFL
jgi:hypothetical protein